MIGIKICKIRTEDAYELGAVCYEPAKNIALKGQLIVNSATGVMQDFYEDFATFFARKGFRVFTFDYRGMGKSKPATLKGFKGTLFNWAQDVEAVAKYAKKKDENLPLFGITHSIGGQLLALTPAAGCWDGLVTVASQSGYYKHWTGKNKWKMWFFWQALLPGLSKTVGYFPAKKMGLFEDIPKGVALQWSKWGRHPDYMKGEFPSAYFDQLTCPILAYSFTDDQEFAPKSGVDWLHQQFVNARVTRRHVDPKSVELKKIGHFNFFRSNMESLFWKETLSFFEKESNKRLVKL